MREIFHPHYPSPSHKHIANRLARSISNLVNPVFVGIFVTGLITFKIIDNPTHATKWFGLTILLTAIPPILYVVYLVKTGYLTDIYMPDREKRLKPILVIFSWLAVSIVILYLVHAPLAMPFLISAVLAQIVFLGIITVLWKISFHSATIMSAATIAILLCSQFAWETSALVPLVGWARIRLKRHTFMQVVAGYLAGYVGAISVFYFIKHYFPV